MPTTRHRRMRERTELTSAQRFELLIGSGGAESAFADEAARRLAWEEHRDELLAGHERQGIRPQAFWDYDCVEPREEGFEAAQLLRLGVVSDRERAEIFAYWRQSAAAARLQATQPDPIHATRAYFASREDHGIPSWFDASIDDGGMPK
jgi:hypothetical protein